MFFLRVKAGFRDLQHSTDQFLPCLIAHLRAGTARFYVLKPQSCHIDWDSRSQGLNCSDNQLGLECVHVKMRNTTTTKERRYKGRARLSLKFVRVSTCAYHGTI